jgi:hypothetical protein
MNDPECEGVTFDDPFHEYGHTDGNCSITGGYVYRGTAIPALQGKYLFSDYCTSQFWSLRYDGSSVTDFVEHPVVIDDPPGLELERIVSFGEDACGELYVCAHPGQVFKLIGDTPPTDCNANGIEDGCEINLGLAADVNGNGVPDACECPCDCALSPDGVVNVVDFLALLADWGGTGPCDCADGGDGTVNVVDFLAMLGAWGSCPE